MQIKKALVPKKNMGTTTMVGFVTSKNDNIGIDTNNMNIVNLTSSNITTDNINATIANISQLNATNANINSLTISELNGDITTHGNITNLSSEPDAFDKTVDMEQVNVKLGSHNTFDELTGSELSKLYSNDISCDYLTVNKKAHFLELVIDKIKTVGGTVIFTPADGFVVDKVTETNDEYILFWRACTEVAEGEIGDTIATTGQTLTEPVTVNMWQEWDQALCQSFNLGDESDYYSDVSNRYWWRVVEAASDEPEIQEINDVKYYCHWIMVYKNGTSSTTGKPLVDTGSDIPAVSDTVAMLGYRYDELASPTQDDINRSSAIIIAAYNTPDSSITAPSYAQYQGIVDFNLSTYRKTYFDATRGKIFGEFVVDAGGNDINLDDYIKSFNNSNPCDIGVITDYANKVDLIVLQTNNQYEIDSINNFPTNLQITPTINGSGAFPGAYTYNSFTLSMFGIIYDLLTFDNTDPTQYLPSGYEGIYLKRVDYSSLRYYKLEFDFTGTTQTITTSSVVMSINLTHISSGDSYSYTKSIPVNSVRSVEGVDAEFYELNTVLESTQVDGNQTLQPELIYNLKYISGTTVTYPVPSAQTLRVTTYLNNGTSSTVTITWDNANNYWRFYPNATTDYYSSGNPVPVYYKVDLVDNNIVVDCKLVDVQLSPMATFSVAEGLTQSIQANTTAINNETTSRMTQYSAISQSVDNISSTVASQTTTINQMSSQVSSIQQNVNNINLSVTQINTDIDTLETGIQTTGIDIANGEITLSAENTIIDGDLHLSGDFTSENSAMMNKVVIDSMNGGIRLYGPDSVDANGDPTQIAQQKLITDIGYGTDPDSSSRYGYAHFYDAKHPAYNATIDNETLYITDPYNTVNIGSGGINWHDNQNNSGGLDMAQLLFRRLRVAHPNNNWYDAKMTDDMITSDYNGAMSINLPDPWTSDGKFYFIKHKRDQNTNIRCTAAENRGDSVIMNDDSASTSWQRNVQDNSTLIFCDGTHWILMELDY